ncbi:MAG: hypothetical protein DME50_19200 [Verrucomicrobia bacterium]|nr:MAG: hypothetical protein DME50_19200 [Verrucomicrobiota bacterium]
MVQISWDEYLGEELVEYNRFLGQLINRPARLRSPARKLRFISSTSCLSCSAAGASSTLLTKIRGIS